MRIRIRNGNGNRRGKWEITGKTGTNGKKKILVEEYERKISWFVLNGKGKERKGKERKGKERKRKGKERKGKERKDFGLLFEVKGKKGEAEIVNIVF